MLKVQLQLILFTSYSTSANSTYKEHTVLSANSTYKEHILYSTATFVQTQTGFEVFEMKHSHNFGRFDDEVNQNLS